MDYSESSRIVSFFTREQGMVKGIAKGARGPRSRFTSSLEPLQRVRVTLSVKGTRDLQTVTQADLLHPYGALREDLFRATYAQAVAELLYRMVWRDQPSEEVYELLLAVLGALQEGVGDPELLFLAFQVHLAQVLGYGIQVGRCASCGGPMEEGGRFSFPRGAAFCRRCHPGEGRAATLSGEVADLLGHLGRSSGIAAAATLQPDAEARRSAGLLLRRHLEYHTETDLTLRSLSVAETLARYGREEQPGIDVKGPDE